MLEMTVSTKERWEELDQQTREAYPRDELHDISYEEMREFVRQGDFDIHLDQTHQIGLELGLLQPLVDLLARRHWMLRIAKEDAGDFVTSDHPVVLLPVGWDPGPYGVGFGLPDTVVIFPLNRRMLVTGMFEGEDKVVEVGAVDVARHNRHVIFAAQRQVYSFGASFRYFDPPISFKSAVELLSDPAFVGQAS